uniref:Catalase-like protein n=1 Tax=Bemisia tabaci TaxID=7038 RepID=A0A7S5HG70_BEMTA|nr:catalase-like protein [Bemisia tabaci]
MFVQRCTSNHRKLIQLPLLICAALFQAADCQRSPTIARISPEQLKNVGGIAELECSVQYAQEYPILWVKADRLNGSEQLPISSGSSLIVRDSRFALRHDVSSSTYTLQIKDIQETDAGLYQCQVIIDLSNKLTSDVWLRVRKPPMILDNSTQGIMRNQGQNVDLECYASGFPIPRISWRRENNAILPTGGSIYRGNILKIPSISKEDRGTYYCVADNGIGRHVSRRISVDVEFPPVITVQRPRLGQAPGFDMDLECHIEAFPLPTIMWIKDGAPVTNNQHYLASKAATGTDFTDAKLRILSTEQRQYGHYQCKATNKLGHAQADIEFYETDDPVCPPACGNSAQSKGWFFW